MNNYLILSAPLVSRIWGGSYFKDKLNKTTSTEPIGEMWSVSGLKSNESIILNGSFKGKALSFIYSNYPELFAHPKAKEFPILIKLISSNDKLSIQVHPDDDYAKKVENGHGKTEGWLILDHQDNASITIGHNAKNKEEIINAISKDNLESLLNKIKVENGEFYPINSGTIHSIGKGILLLEIQQSSELTYRLFDYHRLDKNGKERELHIDKSLDVISLSSYNDIVHNIFKENIRTVWDNKYFKVEYYYIYDSLEISTNNEYKIVTIIEGEINIDNYVLTIGDSFIITNSSSVKIRGIGKIIVTKSKL